MFFVDGMSYREIAEIEGTYHSSVRKSVEAAKPKPRDFNLLLNLQDIIASGKGYCYERWAKVFNIKQIAKVLLFLQEHDCLDYGTLEKRASDASEKFAEISNGIKKAESDLAKISSLRQQIFNYSKTRDIYISYKNHGYSSKFFEEHREAITLHKAAKKAFADYTKATDAKIPKVKELNEEFQKKLELKKKLYQEYRQIKQDMKDYQIAKYDVDRILGIDEKTKNAERENEHKQQKNGPSL